MCAVLLFTQIEICLCVCAFPSTASEQLFLIIKTYHFFVASSKIGLSGISFLAFYLASFCFKLHRVKFTPQFFFWLHLFSVWLCEPLSWQTVRVETENSIKTKQKNYYRACCTFGVTSEVTAGSMLASSPRTSPGSPASLALDRPSLASPKSASLQDLLIFIHR